MTVRQQPMRKQFLLKGVKNFDGTEMVQVKNRSISVKGKDSTEVEKRNFSWQASDSSRRSLCSNL